MYDLVLHVEVYLKKIEILLVPCQYIHISSTINFLANKIVFKYIVLYTI
jgi:hypothetical protein